MMLDQCVIVHRFVGICIICILCVDLLYKHDIEHIQCIYTCDVLYNNIYHKYIVYDMLYLLCIIFYNI